nr:paramyosin-like [Pogona vitticeps]
MDQSAVSPLTEAKEHLQHEIWELRETAANLDTEKQEIMTENQGMKEENRNLEAKIDCFKAMAEDLQKEEGELQATLRQLEDTILRLEAENQSLNETNQGLRTETQTMSSHVVLFQDYKAMQDHDVSRMKQVMEHIVTYFKQLEGKIETAKQRYMEEQNQTAELKRTLDELEQIREVQENELAGLREQLEEASLLRSGPGESTNFPSLLHEMVQAKLVQESQAMQNCLLLLLSKIMWLLLGLVVCLEFLDIFVKLYLFLFSQDMEAGSQLLLISDHLSLLTDLLSLHRTRKPSGLLPF